MADVLRLLSSLTTVILAGCDAETASDRHDPTDSEPRPALIAAADRENDFGAVVARPGQRRSHRYRLANTTPHAVKIVDVINRKTCCGIVHVGRLILQPGEATDVEVTLVVGDKFGEVAHETEVVTDMPSNSSIVLRTTAQAVPAFRIAELSPSGGAILIGASESRRAEFQVVASGTSTDPPVDLDRVGLRSTIKVDWVGPKEECPSDDGLMAESRRFAAWLDPAGPPGVRRAEIVLQDGKQVLHRHVVDWEVVSPITFAPRMIVMKPGKRDCRVLLQSGDRKVFRITRIECKVPGIHGRAENAAAALTQIIIKVEGASRAEGGRGVVSVFTDHPAQGKVDLPFLVLD
ncbi:MAG: hypothetical protein NVSMB9_28670 [Isosphaeraceae bacterium]